MGWAMAGSNRCPALRAVSAAVLGLCLLGGSGTAYAQTIEVCIGDHDNPPLSFPDHDGQAQYLIRQAAREQGMQVRFVPVPWRRCRAGVESGRYQAAGTATATPANQEIMRFPLRDGVPNAAQALGEFHIVVFRKAGTAVDWDGKRFSGLHTPVLFNAGFVAVADRLNMLGVAGDESAVLIHRMMQMLLLGRGQVGVGQASVVDIELKSPVFDGKIEVLPVPFIRSPLFLGVNKAFYAANSAAVDALWLAIERMRAAPQWQKMAPELAR